MKDFIDSTNYEITKLESEDFGFNCFDFTEEETFPHWHGHIEIVYVSSGICSIYINGEICTCNQGDILIIPQNSLHSIIPEKNSAYHPVIIGDMLLVQLLGDLHVQGSMAPFLTEEVFSKLHLTTGQEHYDEYLAVIKNILHEYRMKDKEYRTVIKIEIVRLFTLLKRYSQNIRKVAGLRKSEQARVIIKVLDHLSAHYSDRLGVKAMSNYSNMSEQHFCRTFRAFTGKTFIEFLTQLRLEKARHLIVNTNMPITRIPELTGFCNENYFSRVFKKQYGYTPSHFRKDSYRNAFD